MTEYISAYNPRFSQWKLQDFEWYRIITTGELPAYDPISYKRLVEESKVETRKLTDEEFRAYAESIPTEGKSSDQIARHLHDVRKPIPILPPNTELFYFDPYHVQFWLYSIVFKMDDVLAFEAHRGIIIDELEKKIVPKTVFPIPAALPDSTPVKATTNFIHREGTIWHIGFKGAEARIKHFSGLQYIGYLLEKPETPISCRELYQAASGKTPDNIMDTGDAIAEGLYADHKTPAIGTRKASKICQEEYQELEKRLHDAGIEEQEEIQEKMAALVPYMNLKERNIPDPNDTKAQVNIKKRLDTAYAAIRKAGMNDMAKHLKDHIKPDGAFGLIYTGTFTWKITIK